MEYRDAGEVVDSLNHNKWMTGAHDVACGIAADYLGDAGGVALAGAFSETGPVAVTIGVAAAKALTAGLNLACKSALQNASKFGYNVETKHEFHISEDILNAGKCLRMRTIFGYLQWDAVDC